MGEGGWRNVRTLTHAQPLSPFGGAGGGSSPPSGELEGVLLLQYHVHDGAQICRVDGAAAIYVGIAEVEALRLYTIH